MLKPLAKTAAALLLILSASFSMPALAGSSVDGRKCTGAKHLKGKPFAAAPIRKAAPAGSTAIVEKRKLDVQILSFGP